MSKNLKPIALLLMCLLGACEYKDDNHQMAIKDSAGCNVGTSNKNASEAAQRRLAFLMDLSCDKTPGVLSGQNAGHGSEITNDENLMGYNKTFGALYRQTGKTPAVIGIDYEHDRIFTPEELREANSVLISHAQKGGLVTINWAPISPWLNDETDLQNRPGNWQDTRASALGGKADYINLSELLDPTTNVHAIWIRKLDRVAAALDELQQEGVVVMWRPLQEMNGHWFWWGNTRPMNDPDEYIALWRHMHRYFSGEKKLNNLLWVFSPNKSLRIGLTVNRPALWAYPGDEVVDIVAGTLYSNSLTLPDYEAFVKTGKPLGIAEYGGDLPADGQLDNTLYASRLLEDHPRVAYWVSWHSYPMGDGKYSLLSLPDNKNAKALLDNPLVLTVEDLPATLP